MSELKLPEINRVLLSGRLTRDPERLPRELSVAELQTELRADGVNLSVKERSQ